MFSMQEIHVTFDAYLYEDEDRFIIVDENNEDVDGEHYSLKEAIQRLTEFNK